MKEERENSIKSSIFESACMLLQTISSSLGPKGLDKMIIQNNKTTVTNDGATILKFFKDHPIHSMLSNVSSTQDEECGDGTTSVVVLICSLLDCMKTLIEMNIHPSIICDHLEICKNIAIKYIEWAKIPINEENIYNNSYFCTEMAEVAMEAMNIVKGDKKSIKIYKRLGGIIDDLSVHRGLLFESDILTEARKVKIAAVQFCLSALKTNMDSKILVDKPELIEKVILDERKYILEICKKIKKSGCQLLLVQKSILRESLSVLAKHFLNQLNILVVDKIDRKELEYYCEVLEIKPVSDVDLLNEVSLREVEIQNIHDMLEIMNHGCTILLKGCDELVLDEAERCLNDALCVIKSLKEEPFMVPGGGAIEMGISVKILEEKEGNVFIRRQISGFPPIEVLSDTHC